MPLVEIEDTKLAELQRQFADADNYRKVWGKVLNGKNKLKALELVREDFPEVPIPELDTVKAASEPILSELDKVRKEFQEYVEAQNKREAERATQEKEGVAKQTIASSRRKLKSEGWDDEGIEKVEALMQERQIGDYDVAAAYVRSQLPSPSPIVSSYEGKSLNWFNPEEGAVDHKLLLNSPESFKRNMLKKYFADRASGNLAAWAA